MVAISMCRSPSYPAIDVSTGAFSIDAWVKPTLPDTEVRVIAEKMQSNQSFLISRGYSFLLSGGKLECRLGGTGSFLPSTHISPIVVPADGNWHHVAVTVKRNDAHGGVFYLDG